MWRLILRFTIINYVYMYIYCYNEKPVYQWFVCLSYLDMNVASTTQSLVPINLRSYNKYMQCLFARVFHLSHCNHTLVCVMRYCSSDIMWNGIISTLIKSHILKGLMARNI